MVNQQSVTTPIANPGVLSLKPYQPGKPMTELKRELGLAKVVKLASNENPLGCSPQVQPAIEKNLNHLARYPDANAYYLKQALAEHLTVDAEQLTLGNGSNDVLELIAKAYAGADSEIIYSQYAFMVYPIVAHLVGAKPIAVPAKDWGHDLAAMQAAITEKTDVIYIANPNNPTGTALTDEQLEAFLTQVPSNIVVVIDEAYYEYRPQSGHTRTLNWLAKFPNLVVTRSFSKAYGLAALRIGYSISSTEIADKLNRVRQPFAVNSLALVAAQAALDDQAFVEHSRALNAAGMQQLCQACNDLQRQFIQSSANFITVDFGSRANTIYESLLQQGLILRPLANYKMPNHLRISIGLEEENESLIKHLQRILYP